MKSPRLGCVQYLNARPLIHGWKGCLTLDHPATLCRKLAKGELDVALVSSIEYLRNPIYRIVDGISISSDGPVYSVVVAHRSPLGQVKQILLDPASETSVHLLRIVLADRGLDPQFVDRSKSQIPNTDAFTAYLLIGDQAIRFRQTQTEYQFLDLGEEWNRMVDLPFVFAIWLIRPEIADGGAVADALRALRDENLAHLDDLISNEKGFDHDFCARYYREHLRFHFGDAERQGLRRFHILCAEQGLVPKSELEFNLV